MYTGGPRWCSATFRRGRCRRVHAADLLASVGCLTGLFRLLPLLLSSLSYYFVGPGASWACRVRVAGPASIGAPAALMFSSEVDASIRARPALKQAVIRVAPPPASYRRRRRGLTCMSPTTTASPAASATASPASPAALRRYRRRRGLRRGQRQRRRRRRRRRLSVCRAPPRRLDGVARATFKLAADPVIMLFRSNLAFIGRVACRDIASNSMREFAYYSRPYICYNTIHIYDPSL
jgi:hypothetical protein